MDKLNIKIDSQPLLTRDVYIKQMKELLDSELLNEVSDANLKISCDGFVHDIRNDILRKRWDDKHPNQYPNQYPNPSNEKVWKEHCKKTMEDLDETILKEIKASYKNEIDLTQTSLRQRK